MRKHLDIIILLIVALLIVFYKFNQIPKNLSFDEVEFAKLALSLNNIPYTAYSSLATGHSTLYFYIILLSFKIFGINNFALRLPSAVFGVINVILFYLVMKIAFNKINNDKTKYSHYLPLILSLIFITSRWYFNFARFAFEATFLLFLELMSTYFLFRFLKSEKKIDIILSAVFAALAFNSYMPGRVFFILIFGFLLYQALKEGYLKNIIPHLIISLTAFVLLITPLIIYFLYKPDIRFNQQNYFQDTKLSFLQKGEFLKENLIKTGEMLSYKGDVNGRHNYPYKPAINPVLGILFMVGLLISLKNFNKFPNSFFCIYFLISLIPSFLTYPWENPNMLRTFTAIPSIVFFMGRSIEMIINWNKKYRKYVLIVIILILFASSFYEIRTYFKYQSKVVNKAFEVKSTLQNLKLKF